VENDFYSYGFSIILIHIKKTILVIKYKTLAEIGYVFINLLSSVCSKQMFVSSKYITGNARELFGSSNLREKKDVRPT